MTCGPAAVQGFWPPLCLHQRSNNREPGRRATGGAGLVSMDGRTRRRKNDRRGQQAVMEMRICRKSRWTYKAQLMHREGYDGDGRGVGQRGERGQRGQRGLRGLRGEDGEGVRGRGSWVEGVGWSTWWLAAGNSLLPQNLTAGTGVENWEAGALGFALRPVTGPGRDLGELPSLAKPGSGGALGPRWGCRGPELGWAWLTQQRRAAPAEQRQRNTNAPDAQTLAAGDARGARGDLKCWRPTGTLIGQNYGRPRLRLPGFADLCQGS